jgi:hypothetical protein
MNKLLFAAAALLAATTAAAGVRIETVTRDVKTKAANGDLQVIMVQDGKIRMNIPKNNNGMILKNSIMYVLDDKKKTYMEMDKATMKKTADQAGAAMKQMQEQMAKMTPEQRAQMEKMMGGNMPGMMSGKTDTWDVKNTGKTDTSEGRKCTIWTLNKNGKLHEELCVVPFSSLPGKEDFEKTFKELAESFAGMTDGLPGAGDSVKARNSVKGYPIRTRFFEPSGAERAMETVVTKWVEESIPSSNFDVPAGYKKREMPKMGG